MSIASLDFLPASPRAQDPLAADAKLIDGVRRSYYHRSNEYRCTPLGMRHCKRMEILFDFT